MALFEWRLFFLSGFGIGLVAVATLSWAWWLNYRRRRPPTDWIRIGTLNQINIFPVKSCGPLQLNENDVILCDDLGLNCNGICDRHLMLINDKNEMITGRTYPHMILIKSQRVSNTILRFTAPHMHSLDIDLQQLKEKSKKNGCSLLHTSVWDTKVDVLPCDTKHDEWFSRYILKEQYGLRLVYFHHKKPVRQIVGRLSTEKFLQKKDMGAFCDATSFMLINLSSLDDLRSRAKRLIDPLQFRANFNLLMDAPEPYAEDKWKWLKIGEVIFEAVAPCTRCIFPNINVETAIRDPKGDPLKILKTYRTVTKYYAPAFGIHIGLRKKGFVQVNDIIYVG